MAKHPSQTITVETLPAITFQGAPVITTELLANLYGTEPKNLQMNFANNESRFAAGKHFFKLEGDALKEFKGLNRPNDIGSVEISRHTRNLTLWTERGAARHAKMLDTDQAWEVFERLEDAYFSRPSGPVLMSADIRDIVLAARPDWAAIVRYLELGLSAAEIGKLLDCTSQTVRNRQRYLIGIGVLAGRGGETLAASDQCEDKIQPMSQDEHRRILELHQRGLTQTEIAKRIGRARSSVGNSLQRMTSTAEVAQS